ncbi:MAG TPA: prepilin-type N-terminal cleavage/methylation domain-containing protein [Pseudobdellovibrionaceae bacterium]|nr:prepilin-type N-terminal cleavage/methylation domain-containing protein [Pseudobdellovibrionaceae bacterium]
MNTQNKQNGFSMISVIVAAGIFSVISLGLAYAIGNALKGASHLRNVEIVDSVSDLIGGLAGDPDYCSLLFNGTDISGPFPKTIKSDVQFYELLSTGTLGANKIIGQGQLFENFIKIENLDLVVDNLFGSGRYLGSIVIKMKANTGYNLFFTRKVPLMISTDSTSKVSNCSTSFKNTLGARMGSFSETCTDFASTGWSSKNSCLQDGRWHMVFSHNAAGAPTFGTENDLVSHIDAGAAVRIGLPPGTFGLDGFYQLCETTTRQGTKLVCLWGPRPEVPNWAISQIGPYKAGAAFTNGELYWSGKPDAPTGPDVNTKLNWLIKY